MQEPMIGSLVSVPLQRGQEGKYQRLLDPVGLYEIDSR
jgi:hypothetical protein